MADSVLNPPHHDQVLHGDCVDWMNSLPEACVDLVFADPPYNLQLAGELWRPNMTRVDAVNDSWDQFESFEAYDRFTVSWMQAARRVLKDTGTLWVIGSYHNIYRVGAITMNLGFWILNDVVWIKQNPMPQMKGVRFCNAHETLLWVKKSKAQTRYTFNYKGMKAGNEDKQLRSDWYFPICSGGEREMIDGKKAHTTQKPEALLHRVIASTSNPGDLVLDPFCGTGTTAAVAKRLGRHFLTIDRDESYVEVARRRVDAVVAGVGESGALLDARKPRVSFLSVVETGRLKPGERIWLARSPRSTIRLDDKSPGIVEAIIQADGTIAANGYRGSIHKVGALCLGLPACNGWTHWHFTDPVTGQARLIDDLREPTVSGTHPSPDSASPDD
ncbi:MAG TPA: DNA methyltransferase [Armatimonadota bacterium]|nr:DNA methyltransferase [Armatimonadota bacterium]